MSSIVNKLAKITSSLLAVAIVAGSLAAPTSAQAKGFGPAALLGGVLLGAALAASQSHVQFGYDHDHDRDHDRDCGRARQRVYSEDGDFIGYRWVRAC